MKLLCSAGAVLLFATGCSTPRLPELGPRYKPTNIHAVAAMPATVRRVALLPIAAGRANNTLASGAEAEETLTITRVDVTVLIP